MQFVPKDNIHHEYNSEIVNSLLDKQRKSLKKQRRENGEPKKDTSSLLVMDDCMSSSRKWLKDPNILTILNEGRHYQLTFILSMQYALSIHPELRSNFDYIFMLGEDFVSNRKRLYEHYAGMFKNKADFEQVFTALTENYGCMVINNRIRSSDIEKKIFWYKSKPRTDFKLNLKKNKQLHKYFAEKMEKDMADLKRMKIYDNKSNLDVITELENEKLEHSICELNLIEKSQEISKLKEDNMMFEDEIYNLNNKLRETKKCNSVLMTVLPVAVSVLTYGFTCAVASLY